MFQPLPSPRIFAALVRTYMLTSLRHCDHDSL